MLRSEGKQSCKSLYYSFSDFIRFFGFHLVSFKTNKQLTTKWLLQLETATHQNKNRTRDWWADTRPLRIPDAIFLLREQRSLSLVVSRGVQSRPGVNRSGQQDRCFHLVIPCGSVNNHKIRIRLNRSLNEGLMAWGGWEKLLHL